jgi:hypothetical protein
MNCTAIRTHLPALLYGDLEPIVANLVQTHLATCAACRQEQAALRQLRQTLDTVPVPEVQVDLPRLYQQIAARQTRRERRWRWTAVACGAAAAVLLLVVGTRLEVRLDAHQLVLRWGAPPDVSPAARQSDPLPPHAPEPLASAETERRLQVMSDLIHAMAEEVRYRDGQRQEELTQLQTRINMLQRQDNQRWTQNDRNFAALYLATFGPAKKGELP